MTKKVAILVLRRSAGHRSFDRLYRRISAAPGAWRAVSVMQSGSLASAGPQFGAGSDGLQQRVAGQALCFPANAGDATGRSCCPVMSRASSKSILLDTTFGENAPA